VNTKKGSSFSRGRAGLDVTSEELPGRDVGEDLATIGPDDEDADRDGIQQSKRGWIRWQRADKFHELHG
jgi:hypothetical protein